MSWIGEVEEKYKGRDLVVRLFKDGHRCGYVRLEDTDNYSDVIVHGGITYDYTDNTDDGSYLPSGHWIGFDCAHISDAPDIAAVSDKFNISYAEAEQYAFFDMDGHIRSTEYVVQECKNLIDQIVKEPEIYDQDTDSAVPFVNQVMSEIRTQDLKRCLYEQLCKVFHPISAESISARIFDAVEKELSGCRFDDCKVGRVAGMIIDQKLGDLDK